MTEERVIYAHRPHQVEALIFNRTTWDAIQAAQAGGTSLQPYDPLYDEVYRDGFCLYIGEPGSRHVVEDGDYIVVRNDNGEARAFSCPPSRFIYTYKPVSTPDPNDRPDNPTDSTSPEHAVDTKNADSPS